MLLSFVNISKKNQKRKNQEINSENSINSFEIKKEIGYLIIYGTAIFLPIC